MPVGQPKNARRELLDRRLQAAALMAATKVRADAARRRAEARTMFEPMEHRQVMPAVQFTAGAEPVNATAGTFTIPVTLAGTPTASAPTISTFATGFSLPFGDAVGSAGNIYVGNAGTQSILKVTPAGATSTYATGLKALTALAIDSGGTIYVGGTAQSLDKTSPGGGQTVFASGSRTHWGVFVDRSGSIYPLDVGASNTTATGMLDKVSSTGVISVFASGFTDPQGIAVDSNGNVYVAEDVQTAGAGLATKVSPSGVKTAVASGLNFPTAPVADANNNIFFSANTATSGVTRIYEIPASGTLSQHVQNPLGATGGLALAPNGDIYLTDTNKAALSVITPGHVPTVTVFYSVIGGTAAAGTDYTVTSYGILSFAPGATTANITGTVKPAAAGTADKTVQFTLGTPNGGGTTNGTPATNTLTIAEPAAAAPTLTAISPGSVAAGGPATTITLTGTNFTAASVTQDGTTAPATTFVSPTQLTAVVPAGLETTAGPSSITVATPNRPTTAAQTSTVTQPNAALTSVSPNTAVSGSGATAVTLTGTNFLPTSVAAFNGTPLATTYVSPTQETAVLPAASLTAAGSNQVTVATPNKPVTSAVAFTFTQAPDTLVGISPNSAPAGSPATTITLTGTNFTPQSVVTDNGTPIATTYVSPTQLTAVLPAAVVDLKVASAGVSNAGGPALDGEFANGTTTGNSGDGVAGGDFSFRLFVLPGDTVDQTTAATATRTVNTTDSQEVRTTQNGLISVIYGALGYDPRADLDGSGVINAVDSQYSRDTQNGIIFRTTPAASPAATTAHTVVIRATAASATWSDVGVNGNVTDRLKALRSPFSGGTSSRRTR